MCGCVRFSVCCVSTVRKQKYWLWKYTSQAEIFHFNLQSDGKRVQSESQIQQSIWRTKIPNTIWQRLRALIGKRWTQPDRKYWKTNQIYIDIILCKTAMIRIDIRYVRIRCMGKYSSLHLHVYTCTVKPLNSGCANGPWKIPVSRGFQYSKFPSIWAKSNQFNRSFY